MFIHSRLGHKIILRLLAAIVILLLSNSDAQPQSNLQSEATRREMVKAIDKQLQQQNMNMSATVEGPNSRVFRLTAASWSDSLSVRFLDKLEESFVLAGITLVIFEDSTGRETKFKVNKNGNFQEAAERTTQTRPPDQVGDKIRSRFSLTRTNCPPREGLSRSYVFGSLYSEVPGSSMLHLFNFQELEPGYLSEKFEVTYLGRSSKNTIKLRIKNYLEGNGYIISDETNALEFYIENPDSVSVLNLGGTPEQPAVRLHVTLDGSNLYYKVVSDGVCLSKK